MTLLDLDFAQIANSYTSDEYEQVMRSVPELELLWVTDSRLSQMAVSCENLYRVASLIAYGNGLAGKSDIEYFTEITLSDLPMDYSGSSEIKVLMPMFEHTNDRNDFAIELESLPEKYEKYGWLGWTRDITPDNSYQVFSLVAGKIQDVNSIPELVCLLGSLIANRFARFSLVMVFDGEPRFKKPEGIDGAWLTLARLKLKESPGICPVCGKVIDRRRSGSKGGQPPKACIKQHMDSWQNEQKKLHKTTEYAMAPKPELEERARAIRWQENNNARPFQFSGIDGKKELLSNTGAVRFLEDW